VDGYNATLKCSFDGIYSLSSPLHMWALFPGQKTPLKLSSQPNSNYNCWAESAQACSPGTDPNSCCRFEFTIHSVPHLSDNGTIFSCTSNFTGESTARMCK